MNITTTFTKVRKAPLLWRLSNALSWNYICGWINNNLARLFSRVTGIPTIISELRAVLTKDGVDYDYGVLGRKVVTSAGVAFLVDAWQNSVELEIMKYHGVGTGTGAEAAGDTALGTECTTAINPDNTRQAGTPAEGATANVMKSIGIITFDNSAAITEHGLFSSATVGAGTLWDRTKFTAINVVSANTLTFTYQVTFPSGG